MVHQATSHQRLFCSNEPFLLAVEGCTHDITLWSFLHELYQELYLTVNSLKTTANLFLSTKKDFEANYEQSRVTPERYAHLPQCQATVNKGLDSYLQWFSNERITGKSEVLKALSAMASITSCPKQKNACCCKPQTITEDENIDLNDSGTSRLTCDRKSEHGRETKWGT